MFRICLLSVSFLCSTYVSLKRRRSIISIANSVNIVTFLVRSRHPKIEVNTNF